MQHAAELHEVGLRAFLMQAERIGPAFVAQRVVARRDHQRRRQAGERGGADRRDAPVAAGRLVGGVVVEEPFHGHGIEAVAVLVSAVGFGAGDRVGHGIGEELQAQLRSAIVACPDRHCGSEVATGAITADREARGVDADRLAIGSHPLQSSHDVLERAGETRFGRQAIVDMEDRNAGFDRELGAKHVVAVEVAEHPAASVGVDQSRQLGVGGRRSRSIDAHGQFACGSRTGAVDHFHLGRARSLRGGAQGEILRACVLRAQRVPRRTVRRHHQIDQPL